ncbi:MAG: hypothetical protein EXR60_04105 [Dehalococcoidia bacterium]|nr:hypothetical protein [Dehalococcoidia bacterium]
MQPPSSPFAQGYFGRVAAVGLTLEGRPAIWYVLTGRGRASRQRRATVQRPAGGAITVEIGPLAAAGRGAPSPTAVMHLQREPTLALAGNGPYMDEAWAALGSGATPPAVLGSVLARWGPEPPPYRTPRSAAVLPAAGPFAWVGATVEPEQASVAAVRLTAGRFQCLPTASGAAGSTAPIGPMVETELVEMPLEAQTAEELAEAAYQLFDPGLIVCAIAAAWDQAAALWEVAVKNLRQG